MHCIFMNTYCELNCSLHFPLYTFFSWLLFIRDAHTDRQTNRQDVLRDLWKFAIVMVFNQMHM